MKIKKIFLIMIVFLFVSVGIGATTTITYDFQVLNNKAYNLQTGEIYDNNNYVITSRIFIKSKTIDFTNDIYHHILLWDSNNKYLGYLNSSGTNLEGNKFINYDVTNQLILENNENILDNVNSIAFMSYKSLNKQYIHNFISYSIQNNFSPSRNTYIHDNFNINNTLEDFNIIDTQNIGVNRLFQYFYTSGAVTGGKTYLSSQPELIKESNYYFDENNYNEIKYNETNNKLEYTKKIYRTPDIVNHTELDLQIDKSTWKINDTIKNELIYTNGQATLSENVGKFIFNNNLNWVKGNADQQTINTTLFYYQYFGNINYNNLISNLFLTRNIVGSANDFEGIIGSSINKIIYIRINNSKLTSNDLTGLNNYFNINPLTVTYQLAVQNPKDVTITLHSIYTDDTLFDIYHFYKSQSDMANNNITLNGVLYTYQTGTNIWTKHATLSDVISVRVAKGFVINAPYNLTYQLTTPQLVNEIHKLYDDNYILSPTLEAYNNELKFVDGYMYYKPVIQAVNEYPIFTNYADTLIYNQWSLNEDVSLEFYTAEYIGFKQFLINMYGSSYESLDINTIDELLNFTKVNSFAEIVATNQYYYNSISDTIYFSYDYHDINVYLAEYTEYTHDTIMNYIFYNQGISFKDYYLKQIDPEIITLNNTHLINPYSTNRIILQYAEPMTLITVANAGEDIDYLDLSFKLQLENGNRFTFWQPYNVTANTTGIPSDFPQQYLDEMKISYENYTTNLTENSFNLLVVKSTIDVNDPIVNTPVEVDIDNFLNKYNFNSPFIKIILAVSILIGITLLLFILKMSRIIVLLIDTLLFILFVFLGWLPIWLLMLLAMMIFGYFLISNKNGGSGE